MNKMKSQTRNLLLLLLLLASLSGLLYLMPMDYPLPGFIMKLRLQKLLAYLLVAIAGSLATISFQAITENRFLTPSILDIKLLFACLEFLLISFLEWNLSMSLCRRFIFSLLANSSAIPVTLCLSLS